MRYSPLRPIQVAIILSCLLWAGCQESIRQPSSPLFTLLSPEQTGIDFQNRIEENEGFNVLEYEYFYNGGGVAAGDINSDGLPDLYFTANMGPDQLYLNKGNFSFENITADAGIIQDPSWKTGVSMADVNGDGRLDIYVARSGQVSPDRRRNLLYINNGDLTFTEQGAKFGLDSPSYSNHASFFDYDKDGDLDMYLLNHPIRRYSFFVVDFLKSQRDSLAGDKLFRNDGGVFTDVSEQAGIIGNPLGFGLSATVSDINQDGWPDLYVANDYIEEDYLYINQGNGTFSEDSREWISTASYSSMGADIADINNDGLVDIITLDMLADNHERQKILKGPENHAYYEQMREDGYHDQAMRNMLHVRYGPSSFAEIGRLSGIALTDWSWAPLFADFDNDGQKDLVVTNGYMRDYTNLDFLEQVLGAAREASAMGESFSALEMVREMPSTLLPNYIFQNQGDLKFKDRTESWNFDTPTFSNGAAYADLDADGDLDLVINNINQTAFIYRNEASETTENRFFHLAFDGPAQNPYGIGTTVEVTTPEATYFQELSPSRGYLSSVPPSLHFGLGAATSADIHITWPDGRTQNMTHVSTSQTLTIQYSNASTPQTNSSRPPSTLYQEIDAATILPFVHQENTFNDFTSEPLLPYMMSRLGPAAAYADVNRDGLVDVFLGGARDQPGALYLQQLDGGFLEADVPDFVTHEQHEDVAALFVDVDQDGDQDLYVGSGGNEASAGDPSYQDRLYLNNGFGRLTYSPTSLPEMVTSTGVIAPHDIDQDGDTDLFIGSRVIPGSYPTTPRSYLLENQGGVFRDITSDRAPTLMHPGLVTDARWGDLTGNGQSELLVAGHWMPLTVYHLDDQSLLAPVPYSTGLDSLYGLWNRVHVADLDSDGDLDLIAGNNGTNSSVYATQVEPLLLYASDADANGTLDPIITHTLQGQRHTIYWWDELIRQIPRWASAFPTQTVYAQASFNDIQQLIPPDAELFRVTDLETKIFRNDGSGQFTSIDLPLDVQFAPVNSILTLDMNDDGLLDVFLAGNNFATRAQWGRDAAGQGVLLTSQNTSFDATPATDLGIDLRGDIRDIILLSDSPRRLLAIYNDGPIRAFDFVRSSP